MIRRSIAAFVLATLTWLSVPMAFGSMAARMMHPTHRDASAGQEHSCCPRTRARMTPVLFVAANFSEMPCGTQHPCCARQRPASPSSVPVESKVIRPAAERTLADVADKPSGERSHSVEASAICFLPAPCERSAVLRI